MGSAEAGFLSGRSSAKAGFLPGSEELNNDVDPERDRKRGKEGKREKKADASKLPASAVWLLVLFLEGRVLHRDYDIGGHGRSARAVHQSLTDHIAENGCAGKNQRGNLRGLALAVA